MIEQVDSVREELRRRLAGVRDAADLEAVRVEFVGRARGRIPALMTELAGLTADQKPAFGKAVNQLKQFALAEIETARKRLGAHRPEKVEVRTDVTLPGRRPAIGRLHPVTRARNGRGAGTPIPLLLHKREDGSLRLEIDHKKGIRRGTYLFEFRYRTNLQKRNLLSEDGARVLISWVGPRFADGIDSARVVFRLPTAKLAPRLPPVDSEQTALGLEDDPGGVFLSNLRRASDKDELEVVRPHIAKGSAAELRTQVYIAHEINIVDSDAKKELVEELKTISSMLHSLIKTLSQK